MWPHIQVTIYLHPETLHHIEFNFLSFHFHNGIRLKFNINGDSDFFSFVFFFVSTKAKKTQETHDDDAQ